MFRTDKSDVTRTLTNDNCLVNKDSHFAVKGLNTLDKIFWLQIHYERKFLKMNENPRNGNTNKNNKNFKRSLKALSL